MEKLLTSVYKNRNLTAFLKAFSHIVSILGVLLFAFDLAILTLLAKRYLVAALLAASAFVGYVLVTLLRKLLNAPRPYELYSFYEIAPKDKAGNSFPSRHAYSAFAIATLTFVVSDILAVVFIVLSVLMCVCRVILGIHFIRDVSAGALIGIIAGVIGILMISKKTVPTFTVHRSAGCRFML
jgi:membrane-associated phospholipid phosphatase